MDAWDIAFLALAAAAITGWWLERLNHKDAVRQLAEADDEVDDLARRLGTALAERDAARANVDWLMYADEESRP